VKSELAHEEVAVAHRTAALRYFHKFDAKTADLFNQLFQLLCRPYLCRCVVNRAADFARILIF
jgi:hypothetical protein